MRIRRADVAVALTVAAVGAISAVQFLVTSPGVITDVEFRLMLLAAGPGLVITLTAHWVEAAASGRYDQGRDDDTP